MSQCLIRCIPNIIYAMVLGVGEIIQGQGDHTHCKDAAFLPCASTAFTLSIKHLNVLP